MLSIAKAVMDHGEIANMVFQLYLNKVEVECSNLCQRSADSFSPFRKIAVDKLTDFQWENFTQCLSVKAPIMWHLISSIVAHNDYRNKKKVGSAHHPGICMAFAVLLKERNREMCGVQSLISVLLYNSHVAKQVCHT